jgi:hypothetical protein
MTICNFVVQVSGMWNLLPLPWSGYRLLAPLVPDKLHSQFPCKATEGTNAGIAEPSGLSRAVVKRAEGVLRAHLPDGVSARIEAGLVEYISEIRVCTILFIGFPSLKASILLLLFSTPRKARSALSGRPCSSHMTVQ